MKKGDIIRRVLHSGSPIGSYIVVTEIKRDGSIYGRYLRSSVNMYITKDKDSVKVLTTLSLKISNDDYNHLLKTNPIVYKHKADKSWIAASKKDVDILILYAQNGRKLYYVSPEFKRIVVKEIVAISVNKLEKDTVRITPTVKVYLNRIWYE